MKCVGDEAIMLQNCPDFESHGLVRLVGRFSSREILERLNPNWRTHEDSDRPLPTSVSRRPRYHFVALIYLSPNRSALATADINFKY